MERATPVVRRAAVLLAVEGVALIVLGGVDAVATTIGSPARRGFSYGQAALAVAAGVVLLVLARAIDGRRGWARSPAIVLQLLAVPVGIGLLQGGVWAAGVPVLLLAGVTMVLVLAGGADAEAT
ncbi:MAG: hypothetical protein JJD92_00775 [Frankiaceae bacterium]|nr:hypothetical protein [Frankiaceae bacterium]